MLERIDEIRQIIQSHRDPLDYVKKPVPILEPNISQYVVVVEEEEEADRKKDGKISGILELISEKERLFRDIDGKSYHQLVVQKIISGDWMTGSNKDVTRRHEIFSRETATRLIQRIYRGYRCRKRAKGWALRFLVAKEIFETEKSYVKTLADLLKYFKIPLMIQESEGKYSGSVKEGFPLISKVIFYRIEDLLVTHLSLIRVLGSRMKAWRLEGTCIGDIFADASATINTELYLSYATNYKDALSMYHAYKGNTDFKGILTVKHQ